MHRIDSADNVANEFSEGPPGTVISAAWLNDVQENIAQAIEAAPITLVKGTYTQLTAAIGLLAKTALRAAANTWAILQTFGDGIVVGAATTNRTGIAATGNGTAPGVAGQGGATGDGGSFFGGTNGRGAGITGQGSASGCDVVSGNTGVHGLASTLTSGTADSNNRWAVRALGGHMHLEGGNPSPTTGFQNASTPANLVKAWGQIEQVFGTGLNPTTPTTGFNVASFSANGSNIRMNFASNMVAGEYTATVEPAIIWDGTKAVHVYAVSKQAAFVELAGINVATGIGVNINTAASAGGPWFITVVGKQ